MCAVQPLLYASGVFPNGTVVFDGDGLAATGTYTVELDSPSADVGSGRLTIKSPSDQTGSIVVNGASKSVSLTQLGQRARFTFSGTQNQLVSIGVSNGTWSSADFNVYQPNGDPIYAGGVFPNGKVVFDGDGLPATGTYTVELDPPGTDLGNGTLTITSP